MVLTAQLCIITLVFFIRKCKLGFSLKSFLANPKLTLLFFSLRFFRPDFFLISQVLLIFRLSQRDSLIIKASYKNKNCPLGGGGGQKSISRTDPVSDNKLFYSLFSACHGLRLEFCIK